MPDVPTRTGSRLEPFQAWTVVTDAPLQGLCLAREGHCLLAWDERGQVLLLNHRGERTQTARASAKVITAAISDDASLIVLLLAGGLMQFLDGAMEMLAERSAPSEASNLAIDAHGRYVAVGSKLTQTYFFNRFGRPSGQLATRSPMAYLRFVPSLPMLIGAANYGSILAIEVAPAGSAGALAAEVVWEEKLMSNVGRLATTGDGGMILATCFTHGVQRYDLRGNAEGSYHLGGTATHAVPDFAGRMIAVATLEGELSILNSAGNVRWKTSLTRPAIALECDPLGRFLYYGLETGEITRVDLEGTRRATVGTGTEPEPAAVVPAQSGSVRKPEWTLPVAKSDEQAETAVLAVLDDPPLIGLVTNSHRLQVFTIKGEPLGQAPEIVGVGRILRTSPGWIAAATDRSIVLYDARRNGAQKLDLSLVEVTHLAIRPENVGLAIVQERDRIARATPAGRWVWKKELKSPVEDLALGPDGQIAVTCDNGEFLIFDGAGELVVTRTADPSEPLCLVDAPADSPAGVVWVTLARRFQVLRGHRRDGHVVWESPTPWEGWTLQRVASSLVVSAPDGRTLAYDGTGHLQAQSRAEADQSLLFPGLGKGVLRVAKQGMHLICTDLEGQVRWRAIADGPLGPIAAARAGVAVMIGRSLAWFPTLDTDQ